MTVLALVLTGSASAAGVYRWVDDQGRVHYTDRAPHPGTETETVKVAPRPPVDPDLSARRERQRRLLDLYEEDRSRQLAESQARREDELRLARKCERVRQALAQFERGGALYVEEDDGERARTLEALRRHQAEWCRR